MRAPNDHGRHAEDAAPYLLGALSDLERQAFERHLEGCETCRRQVQELRPAAEALPRSVPPVQPPAGLRSSLMEIVEREAREAAEPARRSWQARVGQLLPALRMRPAVAAVGAAFLLAVGVGAGFGLARGLSGDDERTVTARADEQRVPVASGRLAISDDGESGGVLRVHGMPSLRPGEVYQAWLARDGEVVPETTFNVGPDGSGAAALTENLRGADKVMVTREPHGGARAPSQQPLLSLDL